MAILKEEAAFLSIAHRFDESSFLEHHILKNKAKKVPDRVNFHMTERSFSELVVLLPKCYSIIVGNGDSVSDNLCTRRKKRTKSKAEYVSLSFVPFIEHTNEEEV